MQSSACQSLKLLRIDCHFFCGPHAVDTRLYSYASCLHESLHLHQSCACLKPAQNASSADLTVDKLVYRLHSCTQAAYEWHICRKLSAAASIVQAMLARMRRNTCIPVWSNTDAALAACICTQMLQATSQIFPCITTTFSLHQGRPQSLQPKTFLCITTTFSLRQGVSTNQHKGNRLLPLTPTCDFYSCFDLLLPSLHLNGEVAVQEEASYTGTSLIQYRESMRLLHLKAESRSQTHVYLDGPAGCGKSIALVSLVDWARSQGWLVITGVSLSFVILVYLHCELWQER